MSPADPQGPAGNAASRLIGTVLAVISNRLQLFAVEFKLEKARGVELLLLTAAAAFFGVVTVILFGITVVLLVPEPYRLLVIAAACLLCALVTLITALRLRSRLKRPPPFEATLDQLNKDREWLSRKK